LYGEGRAKANTTVQVRLQNSMAKPVIFTIKSDPRGEWVFAEKINLRAGSWEARARTIDLEDENNISDWSNPRIINVIVSGITVGGINIKFAALSLMILILLILGATIVSYYSRRVTNLKSELIVKEAHEARNSVHSGFLDLRQDVLDEIKSLEGKNHISPAELKKKEKLLLRLENLEKETEKDIIDIEDKLQE
jgi:hypothetical protein